MINVTDFPKTCGIIYLLNDGKFLICHATNNRYWSLPKGIKDKGESDIEAAIREIKEETGIIIDNPNKLYKYYDGVYNEFKDLAIFIYNSEETNKNIKELTCTSMYFDIKDKKELPEVDRYMFIDIEGAKRFMNSSQYKIVKSTLLRYLEQYKYE